MHFLGRCAVFDAHYIVFIFSHFSWTKYIWYSALDPFSNTEFIRNLIFYYKWQYWPEVDGGHPQWAAQPLHVAEEVELDADSDQEVEEARVQEQARPHAVELVRSVSGKRQHPTHVLHTGNLGTRRIRRREKLDYARNLSFKLRLIRAKYRACIIKLTSQGWKWCIHFKTDCS